MNIINLTTQNGTNIYTVDNNGQYTVIAEEDGLYTVLRGKAGDCIEYIKQVCVAV